MKMPGKSEGMESKAKGKAGKKRKGERGNGKMGKVQDRLQKWKNQNGTSPYIDRY